MFTEKIAPAMAEAEVDKLLDLKKILPKRREVLKETSIPYVIEAVSLGLVEIGTDGTITQTLVDPVNGVDKLQYAARIPAAKVQEALGRLKELTVQTKINTYLTLYTGQLPTVINNLEPTDRNTAEAIALFFM